MTIDGSTMTVFILDDDRIELAMWYQSLLKSLPCCKIYLYTDALEFMKSVAVYTPDVAIVDFVLNLQSGADVCKWLHEFYPGVEVYANTGLTGDEYKILAERCHAKYLCKNIKLIERVEEVANGCRS